MKIDIGENSDEVSLRVIGRGVGAITENDINLAIASDAVIIGFNVRPAGKAGEAAEREGVDIRYYTVIYQAIDEIEAALKGMLKPEFEEVQLGTAEVREVFRVPRIGNIAGSLVRSGTIRRNSKARLIRDGVVVADNLTVDSLRRFKDDATEVREGFECGIGLGFVQRHQDRGRDRDLRAAREAAYLTERVDCRPEPATHRARARRHDGWWSGPWWSICGSATCAR